MRNAFQRCTARMALIIPFAALLCSPFPGLAGPILGTAQSFAALGYAGVTNVPAAGTVIWGNVGVSPGTSITGFPPGIVHGTISGPGDPAATAMADITAAGIYLRGLSSPLSNDLSTQNLGARTLNPGVYSLTDSIAHLDGTLTLDALNNPNALFVFQLAHQLTTGSGSVVNVINGRSDTQVYWVLGTQANLGSSSTFEGNILAGSSVVLDSTAQILCGRAFAQTGSVTLIDNLISNTCVATGSGGSGGNDFGSYGFSGGVPEPGTFTLLGMGLGAGFLLLRKFRSIR